MSQFDKIANQDTGSRAPGFRPLTLERFRAEWLPLIEEGMVIDAARRTTGIATSVTSRPLMLALFSRLNEIVGGISHPPSTWPNWTEETDAKLLYLSQGIADMVNPASWYEPAIAGTIDEFRYPNDSLAVVFDLWTAHLARDTFQEEVRPFSG
ncbi:hypothetical protein [Paraburkholderia fungorum]